MGEVVFNTTAGDDPGWGSLFMFGQSDQRFIAQKILHWAQRGECVLCGQSLTLGSYQKRDDAPSFDHIKTRSSGGSDSIFNLALTHAGCNQDRGRSPLSPNQERRVGYRTARLHTFFFNLGLTVANDTSKDD